MATLPEFLPTRSLHGLVLSFVLYACLFVAPCLSKVVFCYYTNWSQYRPDSQKFVVSNIDVFACTHLAYAFAQLDGNKVVKYEENDDQKETMWKQFTDLKKKNSKIKTLLAVGGYSHGPQRFSIMASTEENRQEFCNNVVAILRYWGFDGLDLDWEYPGDNPKDKENQCLLLKLISETFHQEAISSNRARLLLTAALPAGISKIEKGYDIPCLNKYLDYFNVMTYDYHGQWEKFTGLGSPLRAPENDLLNIVSTVNYYLEHGTSKSKFNLGVSFYAQTFTTKTAQDVSLGAPAVSGGKEGKYTKIKGALAYYEVCDALNTGYHETLDQLGQMMYASMGDQWMSYETPTTIATKVDYILANDLAGAMIWALDHDDFNGLFCGTGNNPLLKAVSNRLLYAPDTDGAANTLTTATTTPTTPTTPSTSKAPTTTPTSTTAPTTPTTITTETMPSTTTTAKTGSGGQPFRCPSSNGFYEDSTSCSSYYFCVNHVPFKTHCPDSTVFKPDVSKCVSKSTYDCKL